LRINATSRWSKSKKRMHTIIGGHIVIISVALWISRRLEAKVEQGLGGSWASSKEWSYLVVFILTAASLLGLWQLIINRWRPNNE
jgi:hypothetical protein